MPRCPTCLQSMESIPEAVKFAPAHSLASPVSEHLTYTPSEASEFASPMSEEGNIEAAELLVGAYADGTPAIRADRIKEFKYTKMAAELGSSFSRFWLAHLQRESNDFTSALENARLAHGMGKTCLDALAVCLGYIAVDQDKDIHGLEVGG